MTTPPSTDRGWRVAAPAGVPVVLSPTWVVLFAVVVLVFGPGIADSMPGLGTARAYLVAAGYALLLLVSVLAHEGAHAAAARSVGAAVGRIVIDVFGGHTVYDASGLRPATSAFVAVAGPVANGVLSLLALPLLGSASGVTYLWLVAFVWTNAAVGLFNLLPAHPLDGGSILAALTWAVTGRRESGLVVAGWAGRILVLALVVLGVGGPLVVGDRPSLLTVAWVMLVASTMWSAASRSVREGRRTSAYNRVDVRALLEPVALVEGHTPVGDLPAGLVLVRTGPTVGVFTPTPGTRATDLAGEYSSRLAPGWLVDVPALPPLFEIVDHMHDAGVPVVVLRQGGTVIGAVTAPGATQALARVGIRS